MARRYIFSSESVAEGHPDKVCDTISDQILDACLTQDPKSRVACETLAKGNLVVIAGEITTNARFDYLEEVRSAIREIGYVHEDSLFQADTCVIVQALSRQSRDIAQGVDAKAAEGKETDEQGAGDQGLMFGFAVRETPELMPAPIQLSHKLGRELTRLRKSGELPWLRPDAKTQVSIEYEGYRPIRVDTVVISTQHAADVKHKEIRETLIERVIKGVIPANWIDSSTRYLINPTGRFVIGGPEGDSGSDRAKNHCRFLRRNGPPRWRCFFREGSVQSGSFRGLHGKIRREKRGGRGFGGQVRSAICLRDRVSGSGQHLGRYIRHVDGGRSENRTSGPRDFQFQAGCNYRATATAPPDLPQDD